MKKLTLDRIHQILNNTVDIDIETIDDPGTQAKVLTNILTVIKDSWDVEDEALEEVLFIVGKVFPNFTPSEEPTTHHQ